MKECRQRIPSNANRVEFPDSDDEEGKKKSECEFPDSDDGDCQVM